MCSHTASHSTMAAMTGSRKSFGCGLVKRIRSIPSTASQARRSSPNSVSSSGRRSRPQEFTFCPSSVTSLHTVGCEPGDLGDDLTRPTALLPAANGRDDAVRALRVAAHRDLYPGTERAFAVHRQVTGEVLVRAEAAARSLASGAEPLAEVRDRARAERDVDLRIELEDPVALRLGVAATDGDDELRILALPRPRVAEIGGELGVRLLADRAGVEDEDVGV